MLITQIKKLFIIEYEIVYRTYLTSKEGGSKREAGLRELSELWKLHVCLIDLSTCFLKCTETSQVWFNKTAATHAVVYNLLLYFSHLLQLV